MRTFRRLDISLIGFSWFKISKSQQVILNMKNDNLPYCQSSDMQDKRVTSRGNEKKWLQVFLYTTNSCHSCNSFLYLRFCVGINNFRTIVLQEFFPYLLLLYRNKKQEDSFLFKIVLSELKYNKLMKEGLWIYFILSITVHFTNFCKTDWK